MPIVPGILEIGPADVAVDDAKARIIAKIVLLIRFASFHKNLKVFLDLFAFSFCRL